MFFLVSISAIYAAKEHTLVDVTDGKVIRGISTPSDASGYAYIYYDENEVFRLDAGFEKLSDPKGTDFYEGWLVQKFPFKFISTGKLQKIDGKYVNTFTSAIDYTNYDFYVLTLEPDDGDPAPADHIVEGKALVWKMMEASDTMMQKGEMSEKQKLLRESIKVRLEKVDMSNIDIDVFRQKVEAFKANLDNRWFSEAKKKRYEELLDIILDVIVEMKMMK